MEGSRLQRRAQDAAALEERERLARELHDAVTQSVYSLSLFAEAGRRVASLGQMERVQEYLTMLGDTTVQAMKEMRLLLYELRPAMLEQVGLIGALGQRLEAVERRANIRAHLEVNGIDRLPPEIEEGLYRIAQEALNNALKHSSAKTITVRLSRVDGQPVLEIADDGIGFELTPDDSAEGEGLMNIRELAARLNAKLQIESAPRQGTWIRVTVMQPERDDVDINGKEPIR